MRNFLKKTLALFLIIFTLFSSYPYQSSAVEVLPPVPVSDWAVRTKEVGLTIFGITVPGITLDAIMIKVVKKLLEKLSDALVDYINNGFQNPDGTPGVGFAIDPESFLLDIGDQVAGEYLSQIRGGVLCSPFDAKLQATLRLSIQQSRSTSRSTSGTCTLTGAASNIQNFFAGDFSAGGWQSWFEVSQNPSNNPIGAFLQLKSDATVKIQTAKEIEQQKLAWGDGFLSFEKCVNQKTVPDPNDRTGTQTKNVCLQSETRTPGRVLEEQLQNALGSEVAQLELADEFDEIVSALVGQLTGKIFNSGSGLITASSNSQWSKGGYSGTPSGVSDPQCYPNTQVAYATSTSKVTWTLQDLRSQNPVYLWSGDEITGGNGLSTTTTYTTPGPKSASVLITDTFQINGVDQTLTQKVDCIPTIDVKKYFPIDGTCFAIVPGTWQGPPTNSGTKNAFYTLKLRTTLIGTGQFRINSLFRETLEWRIVLKPNTGSGQVAQYIWSDQSVQNPLWAVPPLPGQSPAPFGYRIYTAGDEGSVTLSVKVIDKDPSVPVKTINCEDVDIIPDPCSATQSCIPIP